MRPLAAFLLLCSVACGQVKLTPEVAQSWTGFDNPRVVNGVVIAGPNSHPVLAESTMTIRVESTVEYKFHQVKATRIPSLERITLVKTDGGYQFQPSAPAGIYAVEYLAFDPEHGIASDEIKVELSRSAPEPIRPEPLPVNEFSAIVEKAIADLRRGYGAAFRSAGQGVERREILLDSRVQSFLSPLTTTARTEALKPIDALLNKQLPRDGQNLKPEAAEFLRSIGNAFDGGQP